MDVQVPNEERDCPEARPDGRAQRQDRGELHTQCEAPPAQDIKIHKCEYCDLTFNTTKGMNIHKGRMHKDVAPTPVNGPVTSPKPPEEIHSQQVSVRAAMNTLFMYLAQPTAGVNTAVQGMPPLLLLVRSVVTPHTGVAPE